jgi:hypothetical protein
VTEEEWLQATDPSPMLEFLRGKASDRKFRLSSCAIARQLWRLLARDEWRPPPDERSTRAVELAEAFVEGQASEEDLRAAVGPARDASNDAWWSASYPAVGEQFPVMAAAAYAEAAVAERVAEALADDTTLPHIEGFHEHEQLNKTYPTTAILRCLFNPFSPIAFNPTWLAWKDGTVLKVAQAIYDERAFDRMPILADALEEAGCTNIEILNHCRQPGEHVRGCWVIDALLGKS